MSQNLRILFLDFELPLHLLFHASFESRLVIFVLAACICVLTPLIEQDLHLRYILKALICEYSYVSCTASCIYQILAQTISESLASHNGCLLFLVRSCAASLPFQVVLVELAAMHGQCASPLTSGYDYSLSPHSVSSVLSCNSRRESRDVPHKQCWVHTVGCLDRVSNRV